jgi:hypothetical protein
MEYITSMIDTSYSSRVNLTGTSRNISDARVFSKGYLREEKFLTTMQ